MEDKKVPFEIEEKEGQYAIKTSSSGVVTIQYSVTEDNVIDKIGIINENNVFYKEGRYRGLVTGTVEGDDSSLLTRAKTEVKEEAGFEVSKEKWIYLGELITSKLFPTPLYCYAADITGLVAEKPNGDGSDSENGIKLEMISPAELLEIDDSVMHSCFLRLFFKLYKNTLA